MRTEDTAQWAAARSIKKLMDEEMHSLEKNLRKLETTFGEKRQKCISCGWDYAIVITTVIDDESPVYTMTKCARPLCPAYDAITLGDHPDIPDWKRKLPDKSVLEGAVNMNKLPDVQNATAEIQVAINRVGVMDLQLPISISQQIGGYQSTVAIFNCFVDLAAHLKGINMSRLPAAIHKYIDGVMSSNILEDMAENIRVISDASVCELEMCFPYFIKKLSPISKEPGWVPYDVTFNMIKTKDSAEFTFTVGVTATSLCPCSKEMSGVNAHNQKCLIQISCIPIGWLWIEDIIKVAEASASGEIYSVLKRPDEQHVTNQMYENPAFVEDIARSIYSQLIQYDILKSFKVRVESDESIHKHKAVAIIETI